MYVNLILAMHFQIGYIFYILCYFYSFAQYLKNIFSLLCNLAIMMTADPGDRCITSMIIICTIWVPCGWLAAHIGFFVPVRFQIYKLNDNRRSERFSSKH